MDEFDNHPNRKCGKSASCKLCVGSKNKINRINNYDSISVKRKSYYYDPLNHESILEGKKKYYQENRKFISRKKRDYRIKNITSIKERINSWTEKNWEVLAERRRQKKKILLEDLFRILGDKCSICGESDKEKLTVDHLNFDGRKDRRKGYTWKREIVNGERDSKNYRILCHSCNISAYINTPLFHLKKIKFTGILKFCPTCSLDKDTSLFTSHNKKYGNLYFECILCKRFRNHIVKVSCFESFGGKCSSCSESDFHKLCIDHVFDSGWRKRDQDRSGIDIYRNIMNGSLERSEFQLLCFNCNYMKSRRILSVPSNPLVDYSIKEISVKEIGNGESKSLLDKFHYAGYGRSSILEYGIFLGSNMIGAVKFASIVRKEVATSMGMNHSDVIELDRMCLHPSYHKRNVLSYSLARIIKNMRNTTYKTIVSFADPSKGHTGAVYKASNFTYLGKTSVSYFYSDEFGNEFNKKSIFDKAKRNGMKEIQFVTENFLTKVRLPPKHKFIYHLNNAHLSFDPTLIYLYWFHSKP